MGREGGFGRGDGAKPPTARKGEREGKRERLPFAVAYAVMPTLRQQRVAGNI